jgi:proton-translocating NAD(P)+ transhydrogenase subunit alpha
VRIAIVRERVANERRVASVPEAVRKLVADGHEVHAEAGAGAAAGFRDDQYEAAGATIAADLIAAIGATGVVLSVNGLRDTDLDSLTPQHLVIGLLDPLWAPEQAEALAATGASVMSLDLVPRSTRAQAVDVLSSMATVIGFQAVLLAAGRLPKLFPLMITAAGTIPPSRVVVLGAGVAGLQAMAVARRLGASVEGFDIRPEALEQIRSLGARSIDLQPPDGDETPTERAERTQLALTPYLADADIVITAAQIPGLRSPILVTDAMAEAMEPGSLLIDLAAQRGGNCTLTQPDTEVLHQGVTVLGPTQLASDMATSASRMFANNLLNLVRLLAPDGELVINREDEVIDTMLVASQGEITHARLREKLGLGRPDEDLEMAT